MRGMQVMDIQAQPSQGFFLKGKLVDENVWPCADRDGQQSAGCVWSGAEFTPPVCKERLRWSKEAADNGQRQHILWDAGSAWGELIHSVVMAGGVAC